MSLFFVSVVLKLELAPQSPRLFVKNQTSGPNPKCWGVWVAGGFVFLTKSLVMLLAWCPSRTSRALDLCALCFVFNCKCLRLGDISEYCY